MPGATSRPLLWQHALPTDMARRPRAAMIYEHATNKRDGKIGVAQDALVRDAPEDHSGLATVGLSNRSE